MASSLQFLLLSFMFFFISNTSNAQTSSRPKALILPISKDTSTNQYTTLINQRTPLVPIKVVVDLGGKFLWVDCDKGYVSSSFTSPRCGSAKCALVGANACIGPNRICGSEPYNHYIRTSTSGEIREDVLSLRSTDGSTLGPQVTIPSFLFTCAPTFLLRNLATRVTGMAGLGRTRVSLPSQFASTFSFNRKFAICLSSSNGVIFFGNSPYVLRPNEDFSTSFTYTPLFINPVSTITAPVGEPSAEYFIGVKSIVVDQKPVSLNTSLLSINTNTGFGGTKISTVDPYTVMHTSIYNAVTEVFIKEANSRGLTRVASKAPFGVCFSSKNVTSTRLGPGVPTIELVLQNKNVVWRIFGANSMVQVSNDVLCLGIVDGGLDARTSIVIGGYQLENNLVQFDLASSRVGFSFLLARQTTCSNFNFGAN